MSEDDSNPRGEIDSEERTVAIDPGAGTASESAPSLLTLLLCLVASINSLRD